MNPHSLDEPIGTRLRPSAHAPDLTTGMPEWFNDALCTQADPDTFYPEKGGTAIDAKRICAACPVRAECLTAGIDEQFGVFGGMSERDRRKLRADGWKAGDPLPPVVLPKGWSACPDCGGMYRNVRLHITAKHSRAPREEVA